MSTFSDAWNDTPPAIRDFYRNYAQRYCVHSWKVDYFMPPHIYAPFYTAGWVWHAIRGCDIAYGNWKNQHADTGRFDTQIVWFEVDPYFPPPPVQPIHGFFIWGDLPDIFVTVPLYADNYPRQKYKVRKHYWTGKPRRRRNI